LKYPRAKSFLPISFTSMVCLIIPDDVGEALVSFETYRIRRCSSVITWHHALNAKKLQSMITHSRYASKWRWSSREEWRARCRWWCLVTAEIGGRVGSGVTGASVVGAGLLGCGVTGALDGCGEAQMSSYSHARVPRTVLQHLTIDS
jgi:hypothetical protein